MSVWQPRQMSTPLVLGSPGCRLAWGLWQSVQSPAAPGCWTLAFSICSAFSEWQVTQSDLASACVSTTLPSFAGAWQTSHCFSANGGCMNFAISLGTSDWWGSWQGRQSALLKGWLWCAFCRSALFASWQSRQRAGVALVRWKSNSTLPISPVLWVMWQVSQPMSSAACRLPFAGTFVPWSWQVRQRLSFLSPEVAFSNWNLLSEVWGSWHLRQSRTAGGCTVPFMSAAFLSAWQVK